MSRRASRVQPSGFARPSFGNKSIKSQRVSDDYSISTAIIHRSLLYRTLYRVPGFKYIRRLLLLDIEMAELVYLDDTQEQELIKRSAADLFYPIHMTRMPIVKTGPSTYFHDGKKRIDFVLMFERDETEEHLLEIDLIQAESEEKSVDGRSNIHRNSIFFKRESFLSYLQNAGIYMEEDIVTTHKKILHFVKLSVSWSMLVKYAEVLQLRVPLEIQPEISQNWSSIVLQNLGMKNIFMQYVPEEPLNFYTASFRREKLKNYLWSDQKETFFSVTQRIRIIHEILLLCHYGRLRRSEVGIERLLEQQAFQAAYPLHDGHWRQSNEKTNNMRFILYHYWAKWSRWYKYQPINHIREYFGEKIAFYFAFLGVYTSWLTIFAVFGIIIFATQVYQMLGNKMINDTCKSEERYEMCPRCVNCAKWYLSDLCVYFKAAGIFDSVAMVIFSIFACLWANTFLANWKRDSALLAYKWSCHDVVWDEQRPRASYIMKAPLLRLNPVTGRTEPYFPISVKHYRLVLTSFCLLMMITISILSLGISITIRKIVSYHANADGGPEFRRLFTLIGHLAAAIVQITIILILGNVYTKLALALTDWEMHRSETEYETNLIFKLFLFQFVNFFSPLFYSAFIKSKYIKNPDVESTSLIGLIAVSNDFCEANSCFLDVTIQLAVFLIAKQGTWQLLHQLKDWWAKPKPEVYKDTELQWEQDLSLDEPEELLHNYLDIVLQFAFITLFVSAFPLAPLFALIKNVIEIRRYAQKLICRCRRPVPQHAKGIDVWFDILRIIAVLSAVTNGFFIAFTSDLIPRLVFHYSNSNHEFNAYVNQTYPIIMNKVFGECRADYRDIDIDKSRYKFLIVYEHIALGITFLFQTFVPVIPKSLKLRLKREQFIARQSMSETATTLQMTEATQPQSKKNIKHRKKRLWTAWELKDSESRATSQIVSQSAKSSKHDATKLSRTATPLRSTSRIKLPKLSDRRHSTYPPL